MFSILFYLKMKSKVYLMGASQSIQSYTLLPDDEEELITLNESSEEVSFADKVETKVCSSVAPPRECIRDSA